MKQLLILVCIICLFVCCGHKHTCNNTNAIFSQHSFDDNEYKLELMRQLGMRDPASIHYYADKYIERAHKPFMIVDVQGDSLCAKMIVDIKNENKLPDYKTARGLSYSGAEITGFQYAVDSAYGSCNFIFEEGKLVK